MQQYQKNFFKYYGLDPYDFLPCWICGKQAVELHHIESSYRGKRKPDPTKLIPVCRGCHDWITANNNRDNRKLLYKIVQFAQNKRNTKNTGNERKKR